MNFDGGGWIKINYFDEKTLPKINEVVEGISKKGWKSEVKLTYFNGATNVKVFEINIHGNSCYPTHWRKIIIKKPF